MRGGRSHWLDAVAVAAALAILAVLVWGLAQVKTYRFVADSMVPTVRGGEIVLAWRGYYAERLPRRGDVVAYLPAGRNQAWIHRVVGLPGDRVKYSSGRLHLDGEPVDRQPAGEQPARGTGAATAAVLYRETMSDGRSYGILEYTETGTFDDTSEFVVPPGHVFMLGDNRDNSMDSRVPGFGFVALERLRDRPIRVIWAEDSQRIGTRLQPSD